MSDSTKTDKFHGAESFLTSWQSLSYSRNVPLFI